MLRDEWKLVEQQIEKLKLELERISAAALEVQLIIGLDRDKAHVLPLDCLGDRLCIDEVVLVRLHERLYKLPCDQPDIVALLSQCTSKKMRSSTSTLPAAPSVTR